MDSRMEEGKRTQEQIYTPTLPRETSFYWISLVPSNATSLIIISFVCACLCISSSLRFLHEREFLGVIGAVISAID